VVDPVAGGFIGWVCSKVGESVLKHLLSGTELGGSLDKAIAEWAKSLPKNRYVNPKALFPEVDPATAEKKRPEYFTVQGRLRKNELPTKEAWHAVFMESWRWVRDNIDEPQVFFRLEESEANKELERLAQAVYDVCVQHEPIFRAAVIEKLDRMDERLSRGAIIDRPYRDECFRGSEGVRALENRLNQLLSQQIAKQKACAKYIPEVFVENYDAKERCRAFVAPRAFWEKTKWEMEKLNFAHLNRFFGMAGIEAFCVELPEDLRATPKIGDMQSKCEELIKLLQEKRGYLDDLKKKDRDALKAVLPPDRFESAWGYWPLVRSAMYAASGSLEAVQEYVEAIKAKVVLITSRAGKGKTNFVCDLAENVLRKRGVPGVFFTARDFDHVLDDMLKHFLEKILPEATSLSQSEKFEIVQGLSEEKGQPLVVIIDGLNESQDIVKFRAQLEEFVAELLCYDFVRVILTCRSEYLQYRFDNLERASFAESIVTIENLEMRECEKRRLVHKYFEFFGLSYSNIYGNAWYLLSQNPLLLRFYCETYGNPNSKTIKHLGDISNIYKVDLFEQYLTKKLKDIANMERQGRGKPLGYQAQFTDALKAIVKFMVEKKTYADVAIDQLEPEVLGPIERLACEDVILRKDLAEPISMSEGAIEVVNFTFDEFRDYLIADYLVKIVWPKNRDEFGSFTDSLIEIREENVGGRPRKMYLPSVIAEGVSRFIFQMARHRGINELEVALGGREWYESTYLESIFAIEDRYVRKEDVARVRDEFLAGIEKSSEICYQLIQRYDKSEYENLNIWTLFSILRELTEKEYCELVDPVFQSYMPYEYRHKDHFTWKVDSVVKTLRGKLDCKGKTHLFEILIFLFAVPSKGYISPALDLYDEFAAKYPDVAVQQLSDNTEIVNGHIRIHIWEKLMHLLQEGQKIPGIENMASQALSELKELSKAEYAFERRLANVLMSIANADSSVFSAEEVRMIEKKLGTI